MKNKTTFLLILLISILFESCGHEENHIVLTPKKSDKSVHVAKGVWYEVPYGHSRAKSYDGHRTHDRNSSISVKISHSSIEELKKKYNLDFLKKGNIKLLELSTVEFGENKDAFFSVVHDKKRRAIRYLLAVKKGSRTYRIDAYCHQGLKDKHDANLRKSIFSTYIGEYVTKKEMFNLANMDLNKMIYTKDGKYPTESSDESIIEIEVIEKITKHNESGLISQTLEKITGKRKVCSSIEFLSNGTYFSCSNVANDKKAYVGLLVINGGTKTLIKCYGNKDSKISDFKKFVQDKFMKTVIK